MVQRHRPPCAILGHILFLIFLEIYIVLILQQSECYEIRTNKQKSRENWIFSQGAGPTALKFSEPMQHLWSLISHPGLLGIWIQQTELLPRKGRATPTFLESKRSVLAHIKNTHWTVNTLNTVLRKSRRKNQKKKSRRVNHIRPPSAVTVNRTSPKTAVF